VSVPPQFIKKNSGTDDRAAPDAIIRFIFVGRLAPQKNILGLIEAMTLLKHRPNWRLDIYGQGYKRDAVQALIESGGLEQRVELHGFSGDIYARMFEADALLFPSLHEGMPNVLVEALQIGLPVLASDIPANRLVIGTRRAVHWFDPRDPAHMAAQIGAFLEPSAAPEQMVDTGRELAAAYTVAAMVDRYQTGYRLLAEGAHDLGRDRSRKAN
jgi:glycosyltransferase involved in cell wall biosynthesis